VCSSDLVVKARAQTGNTWSALAEAVFAVGPVKDSLRISEVMYHPAGQSATTEDEALEFIELYNNRAVSEELTNT